MAGVGWREHEVLVLDSRKKKEKKKKEKKRKKDGKRHWQEQPQGNIVGALDPAVCTIALHMPRKRAVAPRSYHDTLHYLDDSPRRCHAI